MENISDILKQYPITLDVEDNDVIEIALDLLPYSTGFEIECSPKENIDFKNYDSLGFFYKPDIGNDSEQRFRIQNGIKGLNELYNISLLLPKTMYFNPDSGIHYHVDCTDIWDKLNEKLINYLSTFILTELDTWEYSGTYNTRKCEFSEARYWTRFKTSTKTMEFRIGEMAFDYRTLVKRIIHCNSIVKKIVYYIDNEELDLYESIDPDYIVNNRIIKI